MSQTEYSTRVLINSGCIIPSLLGYYTASSGTLCNNPQELISQQLHSRSLNSRMYRPYSDLGCDVTNQAVL